MECISIVVPIYNVEKYLKRCIESIINQTYINIEIILVNDGSTDSSLKICEEYKLKDNRIKLIDKKNGGLSDARNAGINIATGKYVGFVDSDDYIEEDMYEYLYRLIEKENSDIAICGMYFDFAQKKVQRKTKKKYMVMNSEEALKEMLKEINFNTGAWDKLYKKSLFEDIRYPYGKLSEDLFTTYKLIDKSKKIVFGNKPKYHYVQTPNSIMRSDFNEKKLDTIEASEEILEFLDKKYKNIYRYGVYRYTRYNISYLIEMIKSGYENMEIEKKMVKNIKKHILKYQRSKYSFKSKIVGLVISINYRVVKRMLKNEK